ncbi:MAG TPA: hypothetical protein PLK67_03345 [Bryobacteraceae bacterium]|nr:hypothetical protein [Bryobacteraceae bacterium]
MAARVGGLPLRNVLVVAQLALAMVLLSGAGLMTNTLLRLLSIDVGFERDRVLSIQLSLPYQKYDAARRVEFARRLAAEVGRMPGVIRVSAADYLPLQAVLFPYELSAEDAGEKRTCSALARNIDRDFLAVMAYLCSPAGTSSPPTKTVWWCS